MPFISIKDIFLVKMKYFFYLFFLIMIGVMNIISRIIKYATLLRYGVKKAIIMAISEAKGKD